MKKLAERIQRLMPDGVPRYIRCYDNGGKTFDRYTVVYSGHYRNDVTDHFYYTSMSSNPFSPQGYGVHGESDTILDRPTTMHLGKKINFTDLPADCKKLVNQDYKEIWKLNN